MRRAWLAVVLALAVASCGGGGGPKTDAAIGQNLSFTAPVSSGSGQLIRLEGIERGNGTVGVVLAHQLGSSQAAWAPIVGDLVGKGFHVLTFDFRGHGLSIGANRDPSRADLDLGAAVGKLRALGATRIIVVGASMGGTAAIVIASRENLAGVVSISAPSSIDKLNAGAVAAKVKEPALFIVGKSDDARYVDGARSLYTAVSQPKELEIVDSGRHGTDLLTDPKVGSGVRKLIIDFCLDHRG
jgi:alpha-beta hydrolase superfamily lysophospholipase